MRAIRRIYAIKRNTQKETKEQPRILKIAELKVCRDTQLASLLLQIRIRSGVWKMGPLYGSALGFLLAVRSPIFR